MIRFCAVAVLSVDQCDDTRPFEQILGDIHLCPVSVLVRDCKGERHGGEKKPWEK